MVNEIPLSLYNIMFAMTIGIIIFTLLHKENVVRIVTSFLSTALAYILSFISINGNLISIQDNNVIYIIRSTTLNYFWLFIAIVMGIFTVLFIIDEININLQAELNEAESDEL